MNVTLVYPLLSRKRSAIDENKQFWPPLGLAYIAAILERGGHVVRIIDRDALLRKNDMDFDRVDAIMLDEIRSSGSRLVGISATTPNMSDVGHVARIVKEAFDGMPVVLGGPHPSGEPALSLTENPCVDIVIKGEGELAMLDIAAGAPQDGIRGIYYRKDGAIVSTEAREVIRDIDELPMPARHLLDMKFYTRPSRFTSRNLSLRTTSIFTARGCPYRCNFCAGPLVFSGKVRFHSPARVIAEIDELVSKYGIEALYFAEDMFLSSKKRAEELLGLFIDKGVNKKVSWMAQAKASIITPELLALMKEAGCVGIEYGFESGSQRVLDLMNKHLKVEESLRAAELARKARMRFQANIIVGYPGEREDDFRETINFIKKIKPNMVGFNIFMPLPGTPSYEALKAAGRQLPRWDDIGDPEAPQVNYADMPEGVFERLYLEARLKVILPMNLRSFIRDNIKNPLRLLKIGVTQFRGVLLKTMRSIANLRSMKNEKRAEAANVLFLSYNGLLEPILPSQAIPYLTELSKKGFRFTLLTYEKKADLRRAGKEGLRSMREMLGSKGIEWHYLTYHKNPPGLSTIYDLGAGALAALWLIARKRIRIVHVRGITPGIIMLSLSRLLKVKILFDMRGLLAEEYVGGGLWSEGSVSFRLVKKAEKGMLKRADAVTVLTRKHLELNRGLDYLSRRNIPMDVVPCCVDTARFRCDSARGGELRRRLGLERKFVILYPGKIGTFYLIDEMLDFFRTMVTAVPDAAFLLVTNDDPSAFMEKARAFGIPEGMIKTVRGVPFEEMPQYMNTADAGLFFINPYKKIGSSPIKMGEFLACGVPVIINPGVGDTEDLVRKHRVGVVVEKFSEEYYVSAIKGLLALKSEGEALRSRCRAAAEEHLSLAEGVDRYAKIYKELCGAEAAKG